MCCPRCSGYLTRDYGFEWLTNSKPAYCCVNCGYYLDRTILRNRGVKQHDTGKRPRQPVLGNGSDYVLNGFGGILDCGSLFDLM